MGKVYKRKGHNNYTIRYEGPRRLDGTRTQKMESLPEWMTLRDAEAYLRNIEQKIYYGEYAEKSKQTVGEYMAEWLEYQQSQISASTCEAYKYAVKHIVPMLGHHKLADIKPFAVQAFYTNLLKKKKLSAKTIKNIHGVLHKALDHAVKLQIITRNVADAVEIPKIVRPEIKTLSQDDMVALITAIQDSPFRLPILIAMSTGMRKSEILGLKWCDFDRTHNILSVRRALSQIPGKVFAKDTKSGRPRVVPIPASLALMLTERKQEQETQGIYKPDGWICARVNGDVLTPRAFGQAFHRLKITHNFDFTLHGLRHTQATMLIAAGVPVKIVSERLGHATSSITQDIYAHVLPHMQERAVMVVDSIITPLLQTHK